MYTYIAGFIQFLSIKSTQKTCSWVQQQKRSYTQPNNEKPMLKSTRKSFKKSETYLGYKLINQLKSCSLIFSKFLQLWIECIVENCLWNSCSLFILQSSGQVEFNCGYKYLMASITNKQLTDDNSSNLYIDQFDKVRGAGLQNKQKIK